MRLSPRHAPFPVLLLAALLTVACSDATLPPATAPDADLARGATTRVQEESFPCFTSHLTPEGPHRYRYGQRRLRFPRRIVEEARGEVMYFRYVQRTPDGTTLRVANCVIPRSDAALELARQRFAGKRSSTDLPTIQPGVAGSVGALSSGSGNCVSDNSMDNPCVHEEVGGRSCELDPRQAHCESETQDPWDGDFVIDECIRDPNRPGCKDGGSGPCWDCWDGGGGGVGGDASLPIVYEDLTYGEDREELPDSVKCGEAPPGATPYTQAVVSACAASRPPTSSQRRALDSAMEEIDRITGCEEIARRARSFLVEGTLRVFPHSAGRFGNGGSLGGYGGSDFPGIAIMISDIWFGSRVTARDRDGTSVTLNLRFAVVHEVEHTMGRNHLSESNFRLSDDTFRCAGIR
jgi:hypothetical protein